MDYPNAENTDKGAVAANPTPAAQPIQQPQQPPQLLRRRTKLIVAVSVAVIAIAIGVLALLSQGTASHVPAATTYPTTSVAPNPQGLYSKVYSFLGALSPANGLHPYPIYNIPGNPANPCAGPAIVKWYLPNGADSITTPINSSSLNQALPFAEYIRVGFIDQNKLTYYKQRFALNRGDCNMSALIPLISNTSLSKANLTVGGISGYLTEFSNFNQNAFNLTSTYYVGQMPNINWYFIDIIYKNVSVEVGDWGFAGHMNSTRLLALSNQTLEYLKSVT